MIIKPAAPCETHFHVLFVLWQTMWSANCCSGNVRSIQYFAQYKYIVYYKLNIFNFRYHFLINAFLLFICWSILHITDSFFDQRIINNKVCPSQLSGKISVRSTPPSKFKVSCSAGTSTMISLAKAVLFFSADVLSHNQKNSQPVEQAYRQYYRYILIFSFYSYFNSLAY